ncbi:uncharacterized protein LY89DRAFT_269873 [Mollisia scopiformis]|uniref:C2H2-type domain-containing protein n=1 Tax=Mollisia scopiformis TaxID=149040 RepID=A0A132BDN2_MOLSC|nr:uncharacterized protein LY89DRAFT_269873 [Mollisia scopiformis]KUJ10099.1 hypothetical protein LY89DRAFT_269873 [Mollisia scopiformis]
MANPKTVHLECDPSDQQKKSLRAKQRSAEILNRPRTNTSSQNREVASGNSKPREIGNQSKPLHDEQTLSDIVSDLTNENKNLRAQVQILRNHWQAEVEDLAKREEKRKSNELILRAEIQHLKDARRERERAGLGDMEEELYLKTHDTYRWQARVAEMQDMKLFVDGNSPRVRPIEEKIIQQALDSVAVELQILRAHDTSNSPPTSVALGQNSDLDLLLRSMIPEARDMAHRRTLAVSNMFKWGLSIFARGLAVAAIKDWVMDTDFPSFIGSGDPRILEEYRKILSNFDGWQRLHNLEMAAYRSLTETIYFKESFLPRAANDLADRLSMALVPLFVHTSDASLHEGFASWGEDEVTSKNRQLSLKRMFEAALRLKVATVLTDERYQFQLHPLGTVSKASISDGEYRNNPVARNDDMTKNWLHASLMVYRGEQSNPRDRMEDALVHPKNFFSTGEKRSRPPLATQRLTVRDGTCSQTSEGASSPAQRAQKDTLNEQQRKEEAHMPVTNSRPPKRSHNNTEILDNITSEPASKRQMLKGLEPSKSLEMSPQLQTSIVRNGVHDMDCEHEEVESSDGIPIRNSFPYTSCHAESGTERNLLKHQQEEHPELSHDRHTLNSLQSQSYSTPTITKLDNTAGEGHVDEKVTSRKSRGPNSPSTHCGGCDKSFASSYSLKQHQKNKICKGRKCKECDDVFWKLADLETHMHHEHAQSMLATPLLPSSEFQSRRSRPYNQTSIPLASPFSTAATETNAACPEQETFIAPTTNEMMNFPRTRFKSSYSFPVSEQDNMWGSNTMSGTVLGSQSSPEVMEPKPDRGDSHHGRDYNNKSASTDNGLSSAKRQGLSCSMFFLILGNELISVRRRNK